MSQRLGPADGRFATISTSSRLLNDFVMQSNNINMADGYAYRQFLMSQGPRVVQEIQGLQVVGAGVNPNGINMCHNIDRPLLKVPNTY